MQKLENVIYELKKEYNDIFHIQIEGENFIFRPLNRFEYEELLVKRELREDVLAETICSVCTLYPKEYDFSTPHVAGIPESLSEQIIYYSAFENPDYIDEILAEKKEDLDNNVFTMMENVISVAFPGVSIKDMKNMTAYQLIDYYSRASWIIRNMYANVKVPDKIPGENSKQMPKQQQQANPQHMQSDNPMQFNNNQQGNLHQVAMQKQTMGDNLGPNFQ